MTMFWWNVIYKNQELGLSLLTPALDHPHHQAFKVSGTLLSYHKTNTLYTNIKTEMSLLEALLATLTLVMSRQCPNDVVKRLSNCIGDDLMLSEKRDWFSSKSKMEMFWSKLKHFGNILLYWLKVNKKKLLWHTSFSWFH